MLIYIKHDHCAAAAIQHFHFIHLLAVYLKLYSLFCVKIGPQLDQKTDEVVTGVV